MVTAAPHAVDRPLLETRLGGKHAIVDLARVAEHRLGLGIPADDAAVLVDGDDGIQHAFQN